MTNLICQGPNDARPTGFYLPLILSIYALLTACQEDSRAGKTSAKRSAELTELRLEQATDTLFEAFGQNSYPGNHNAPFDAPPKLTWSAPLTREDGSVLKPGQIAKFRIYYRMRHENRLHIVDVDNPVAEHYFLAGWPTGVYEIFVTAVDQQGLESARSEPLTLDIIAR
ncbi:fibronectin type III domain-containing protein [Marinobacter salinisoli]|uniref:Fibronectin type III domain-containing protein n=1 Tax=Marinobacter salinisoli TaxID=2769486 RepID=A0ABX7MX20_9GAMM|nr:fibronectin type III domain-containing protein [Marinobacter salinisoli]QSP95924.1 fibronectin type III domain-containing protein [Marinobacter salinisoli]